MCSGTTTARADIFIHGQSGAKTHGKRVVDLTKAKQISHDNFSISLSALAQFLSAFKHCKHYFCPRTYSHTLPAHRILIASEDYPECLAVYHRMQIIYDSRWCCFTNLVGFYKNLFHYVAHVTQHCRKGETADIYS